jgi:hypothetical protein
MSKIDAKDVQEVEAVVFCIIQGVKNVWIPTGYYGDGDRDAGIVTLYRLGDTVKTGIARGSKLIAWCEPCHCTKEV